MLPSSPHSKRFVVPWHAMPWFSMLHVYTMQALACICGGDGGALGKKGRGCCQ